MDKPQIILDLEKIWNCKFEESYAILRVQSLAYTLNKKGEVIGLNLSGSQITNIDALIGLASLKELNLENTQINDIEALIGLTNLESLNLENTLINEINALKELSKLTILGSALK